MANNFTQQQEKEIENIVKRYIHTDVFKSPVNKTVPAHRHDGVDNIKIPKSSIVNSTVSAFVLVSPPNGIQTIPTGISNPSQIYFDGIAFDGVSSIQLQNYVLGNPGSVGSQTATLASAWGGSTGNQAIVFTSVSGGGTERRSVSFTNGSLSISWSPALTLNDSLTINSVSAAHKSIVTGYAQLGTISKLTSVLGQPKSIRSGIFQTNSSVFFDSTSGSWVPYVNADQLNLATIYDSSFNVIASLKITDFTPTTITIATTCSSGYLIEGSLAIT